MPTSKADKAKQVKYSPWLTLRGSDWYSKNGYGQEFCCAGRLLDYFDLKPAKKGRARQIRFRISSKRLGGDYEVCDGARDLPIYCGIFTSRGREVVMLYKTLGLLLYDGCWVGLESREVPSGQKR